MYYVLGFVNIFVSLKKFGCRLGFLTVSRTIFHQLAQFTDFTFHACRSVIALSKMSTLRDAPVLTEIYKFHPTQPLGVGYLFSVGLG